MDFELLSESPQKPLTLLQLLERLLTNRRRQWQIWGEKPPYLLATVILLVVSLEITLSHRLFHNLGSGVGLIQKFYGTVLFFLICEVFFVYIASKGAQMVGKEGNFLAGLTYLSLSLLPFGLILPVTAIAWVSGNPSLEMIRLLIVFALGLKVVTLWKGSIELVYKLTPVQSGLVLYASMGIAFLVSSLFVYVNLIRAVSSLISG